MGTAKLSIALGILLIVVIGIGVLVVVLYRNKINRALREEQSGAHIRIPAPADTVNGLFKGVVLILLVYICISMGRLNSLQQEIENVKNDIFNATNSVNAGIEQLKEEMLKMNSKVYSYTSTCSSIDPSDNTCMVKHSIALKSFSDDTEVIFTAGDGKEERMVKTGEGKYEIELKTSLFKENSRENGVTIKENGISTYETLIDENAYMGSEYWERYIPSFYGGGSYDIHRNDNELEINRLSLFSDKKNNYNIASAKLLIEKNGTEIDSIDAMESLKETFGDIVFEVNKKYEISANDVVTVRFKVVTEEGYTLDQFIYESKEHTFSNYGKMFSIYDRNGSKVFPYCPSD